MHGYSVIRPFDDTPQSARDVEVLFGPFRQKHDPNPTSALCLQCLLLKRFFMLHGILQIYESENVHRANPLRARKDVPVYFFNKRPKEPISLDAHIYIQITRRKEDGA